jgi:dihydrofolate reductase
MPNAHRSPPAIEFVVAVSDNDVIGRAHRLPWHLPDDLKRFKSLTLGKPILMGRKTYQSIGKALPGRLNMVMSRSPEFQPADASAVDNLDDARAAAGVAPVIMVIGGSEIYSLALDAATRIHLTLVHTQVADGDAYFSGWRDSHWVPLSQQHHAADERHAHPFSFITLARR